MEHVYGMHPPSGLRPARPGRAPVVAPDLTQLRGPTHGIVELSRRLLWQEDRRVDLDESGALEWMYALVLREAVSIAELRTYLDADILIKLWDRLYLPSGLRSAWHERHPELTS